MNTLNQAIENALKYANSETVPGKNLLSSTYGIYEYWKDKDTVKWSMLCEFSSMIFRGIRTPKFSLCMLVYLLENNLYQDEYKDKLMSDLPYLKRCISKFKTVYNRIFKGDYNEVYFIDKPVVNKCKGLTVKRLYNCNNFLGTLFVEFLKDVTPSRHYENGNLDYDFMRSVTDLEINSLDDIDSSLFWHQIAFFKSYYDDEKMKDNVIKNVCNFYRWLFDKYSEHEFLKNSTNLTYELLFCNEFITHIKNDAYFTTLTKAEDLGDKSRIVFIIRNLNTQSTIGVKNSHFALYTDKLESSFYRIIVNKYFQNAATPSMLVRASGHTLYVIKTLHMIEQVKSFKNYPNSDLTNFNTDEAIMIRKFIIKSNPNSSLTTLNTTISIVKRFFRWAKQNGGLTFDTTFFDYFSQYEEPNQTTGNAIPDDDIEILNNTFIELCNEDSTYKLYYAIFLILIETEFRVSQVCNLTVSALQPSLKKDQFMLHTNTKTSHGRKVNQPICMSTKKILESIIEDTEPLRNKVLQESYKDHIFLYQTNHHINSINAIKRETFNSVFQKVCKKAGTKLYSAKNLRDTHMTKAFEFILRHGKTDLEMGLLSKHSRIDTTKNHYIEMELTKMLESTYQITLGNRDVTQKSRILDELPNELENSETLVENGCGHCMAKTCSMTGSLPCLICEDFVTTIKHKSYFIKMISNCDELLKKTTIRHEIEDINLIKTLYVNWLREIYIKEEEDDASKSID